MIKADAYTVSIAIPAYNEEANIVQLLESLISQEEGDFVISEIDVLSDGSSDKTVSVSKAVQDKRIRVTEGTQRIGKPERLNQIFSQNNSDILVILDADIILKDRWVISKLVSSFKDKTKQTLVCGTHFPITPKTYVESLAYFGFYFWEEVKTLAGTKAERYVCNGLIRAFSRAWANKFKYPEHISSGEDAYSYYFSKVNSIDVIQQSQAIIYFKLPSTAKDYINQMSRFMNTPNALVPYFKKEVLERYDSILPSLKLKAFWRMAKKSKIRTTIGYVFLQIATNVYARYRKQQTELWSIASSSKDLELPTQ